MEVKDKQDWFCAAENQGERHIAVGTGAVDSDGHCYLGLVDGYSREVHSKRIYGWLIDRGSAGLISGLRECFILMLHEIDPHFPVEELGSCSPVH